MNEDQDNPNTDESPSGSPLGVHPIVMCRFIWPSKDDEYVVEWQKTFALPFMPREGDRFEINGCSYVVVTMASYSVDEGIAEVFCREWTRHCDSWEEEKQQFDAWGWEIWDPESDTLPPCFDT